MVKRDFIRNAIIVLIAIVGILLLRSFVFSTIRVHAPAANQYVAEGDVLVFNHNKEPLRQDFVVYRVGKTNYIGRVIATSGQTVTYMEDILYLDGKATNERYLDSAKSKYLASAGQGATYTNDFSIQTLTNNKETKIPKGSYLILNDDRKNTKDSRSFGLIKTSQIKGVVSFRVWPLKDFGFIRTR